MPICLLGAESNKKDVMIIKRHLHFQDYKQEQLKDKDLSNQQQEKLIRDLDNLFKRYE